MPSHPTWIKVRVPTPAQSQGMAEMRELLARHRLDTVCQSAHCPNAVECWSARTATFLVLGEVCTRNCRFCDVPTGNPAGAIDAEEPKRLADAIQELGLSYVVITSVDRDDLPDGGAVAFAHTIDRVAEVTRSATIEALIPDFGGARSSLDHLLGTRAKVLGHNLETVRRLTSALRDRRAGYQQSLDVLSYLAEHASGKRIKSGLMVGLGESPDEIRETMADMRDVGVDVLTIGQYLQPSKNAVSISRFVPPDEFEQMAAHARSLGFRTVIAGPLVRSSYHASEAFSET
ncbi:lipoyl synthase [Candidatus Bipolaricaulota bacterium]